MLARKSSNFCWEAIALAADSEIIEKVKQHDFSCSSREKASSKKEKGIVFILEIKTLIHDLGRAIHHKMPSASGEEPPKSILRSPADRQFQ